MKIHQISGYAVAADGNLTRLPDLTGIAANAVGLIAADARALTLIGSNGMSVVMPMLAGRACAVVSVVLTGGCTQLLDLMGSVPIVDAGPDAEIDAPFGCYGPHGWRICLGAMPSSSIAFPQQLRCRQSARLSRVPS